ncbi:MAG: VWA domain-containing protein [Verrucomicrobiales bacterium]|nr:VWA domain-containing protein [Verrucomicrobiales bacterium]
MESTILASMSFGAPQFLILLPLLFLAGWFFRSLALWRPLRALLLILLVTALCDPALRLRSDKMDLWVLFDRSSSASEMVEAGEDEWKSLLLRTKPGRENQLHFIDYASEVIPGTNAETNFYSGATDQTRTGLAINDTLARMESDRHHGILVFTDGYSTEPLDGIAAKLMAANVPLDYRLLRAPDVIDFQVTELKLPSRSQLAEPFVVDITVKASQSGTTPLTVYRNETALFTREVEIVEGTGHLRFADRITSPGAHRYRAVVAPELDTHAGNNQREQWIEIVAGPRLLLVTRYNNDPLASTLSNQGFAVETVSDDLLSLTSGALTGARAVILNNVPAYELPSEFLNALDFFVKEQGGGLLMAGGKNSFGSGGYYQSAVDELLPVTMELKNEHRRLSVAMAIVMDRSGSMAAITSSGNSKMQLANEGGARAIELLGETDAVTVFAVDSQAHEISPLLNVGKSRGELIKRVRSIESMGGGIFVYTGMKAAWDQLKQAEAGQRHMILFTDAADSEEPGEYKALLKEMQDKGATVSVIGLGTRSDADANFIQDIASRGNGRMFFTTIPGEIPNIFAQETVSVARSTFVEEAVPPQSSGKWHEIAQRDLNWPQSVDGYNLSYLREGDETALVSTDRYAAPLVAFGRRGIGRTAAVAFPLGGDYSESVRSWESYGDFQQTFARWLIGEQIPPGIGVRHEITGSELRIDLIYDSEIWASEFAKSPPRLVIEQGDLGNRAEELIWERLAPGHYSVKTELRESEPLRGAVQVSGTALPFGPVVAGSALEWEFHRERVIELEETSRTSGGGELLDLSQAWRKPEASGITPIREWFFLSALFIFLLETFATRTGWSMLHFGPRIEAATKVGARKRKTKTQTAPVESHPTEAEAEPAPEEFSPARRTRFQKAKKRH